MTILKMLMKYVLQKNLSKYLVSTHAKTSMNAINLKLICTNSGHLWNAQMNLKVKEYSFCSFDFLLLKTLVYLQVMGDNMKYIVQLNRKTNQSSLPSTSGGANVFWCNVYLCELHWPFFSRVDFSCIDTDEVILNDCCDTVTLGWVKKA